MISTPPGVIRMTVPVDLQVRLVTTEADAAACQALIASVYASRYGVSMTDAKVDPNGRVESFPDRYAMGLVGDELVACTGLYTRRTYVERFGDVSDADIARVLDEAGVKDGHLRRRFEYTKIVVKPRWCGRGIGQTFIGATHARAFLCAEPTEQAGLPPIVLVCANLRVFRLWERVGVRTRRLKSFPTYANHERYRSDDNPMESRLVIPELDVDPRWYDMPLPGAVRVGVRDV